MMTNPLPSLALLLLMACAVALATGLVAQYGFGLQPCILCLTQRVPFALAGGLAALALWRPMVARPLLGLAALALLVNGGIAFYHTGVEQHWWASSCSGNLGGGLTLDLAADMNRPAIVPCDDPPWMWHGITMAMLNIPFSGGLGLASALLLLRTRKELR